jgi:hypothetical protein
MGKRGTGGTRGAQPHQEGGSGVHLKEPWQDIRGLDVQGEQVGTVENLYVDRVVRLPRFLDVSGDGFLGMRKKYYFLVPVEELSREVSEEERVTVNQNRAKVVGSPELDPDEAPRVNLQRAVYAYYDYSPPEGT